MHRHAKRIRCVHVFLVHGFSSTPAQTDLSCISTVTFLSTHLNRWETVVIFPLILHVFSSFSRACHNRASAEKGEQPSTLTHEPAFFARKLIFLLTYAFFTHAFFTHAFFTHALFTHVLCTQKTTQFWNLPLDPWKLVQERELFFNWQGLTYHSKTNKNKPTSSFFSQFEFL